MINNHSQNDNDKVVQLFINLKTRVDGLESTISDIEQCLCTLRQQMNTNCKKADTFLTCSLKLMNSFEKVWYTNRSFPVKVLHVLDGIGNLYTNTEGWSVSLRLTDAQGNCIDQLLHSKENILVKRGIITLCGLRFSGVSSKNGGFFVLEVKVNPQTHSKVSISPFRSTPFTVLSSRLIHQQKGSFSDLLPHNSISMMPGIGILYTKMFASIGLKTISDLAGVSFNQLNDMLRIDKGNLTKLRLEGYVLHAQEILERSSSSINSSCESPPTKRLKTESEFTQTNSGSKIAQDSSSENFFGSHLSSYTFQTIFRENCG
eukprot:c1623_g1_i1.p1 GENE.c1623_g1_i1~~c1623_g1_i1.p1  ORF type:complete len:317 (-),score=15.34 c1623_g1_i1:146-1096(-)